MRGPGLMIGIEVDRDGNPDVKVRPPLILTPAEAEQMCDRLEQLFLAVA